MYDIAELKNRKPIHAEGHPCIILTDPSTGKIKEKIEGTNHVFLDAMLITGNWINYVNYNYLCLNDSAVDIDPKVPYLLGQTIGYGRPGQGSSGDYRGAYNATNSIIARKSIDSMYWKWQYDFTTAQANGTIRNIGLTPQYIGAGYTKIPATAFPMVSNSTNGLDLNDGRYTYACATTGIITKVDLLLNVTSTIDASALIGNTNAKQVGYNPSTKHYYIYNSTAKTLKEFTDATFSSLVATYSTSNITVANGGCCIYIYGELMYWITGSQNSLYYANFVANTAQVLLSCAGYNNAAFTEIGAYAKDIAINSPCPVSDRYVMTNIQTYHPYMKKAMLLDLSTGVASYLATCEVADSYKTYASYRYPLATTDLVCMAREGIQGHNAAISAKKLDVPVVKTSSNGMTVTYELEVFW